MAVFKPAFSNMAMPLARAQANLAGVSAGFEAAIDAASLCMGATAPNPPVGCALLDLQGNVLTVAAHRRAGEAHAERLALDQARACGVFDAIHSAVVTLEPCNHHGRTPPCTQALLNSPVKNVWIGARDPNPIARGGAETLSCSPDGPKVHWAESEPHLSAQVSRCDALIAPFRKVQLAKRCFITVKQALNADGSMIPPEGHTTFTSTQSLILAHQLRRATDAIITGAGTILRDHPRLTVRRVPDHTRRAPRIMVICDQQNEISASIQDAYDALGFKVWVVSDVQSLPERLADAGVLWALVEAGPRLLAAISDLSLWDEWLTIQARPRQPDETKINARHASPTALLSKDLGLTVALDSQNLG